MNTTDILIKNAKVFHRGQAPVIQDVAIADGRIAARGQDLPTGENTHIIDADGMWLMPGLFDIHTHYDLELEVAPDLPESTRHGTTTVVIANCSLGLAYGNQRKDDNDPIVSCYARVENIPKNVLRDVADRVDWTTPAEYLTHLDSLNLGPNVVTLMPHSMMRIEAMGFEASISRDPTPAELNTMTGQLREALNSGYVGFSTDALPFHYLANQPYTARTIPTQFAKYSEIKALTQVVREEGAIWQATPPKDTVFGTLKTMLLTSGTVHGKPLKTTVVAAMKITNNWKLLGMVKTLAHLLNSRLLNGRFYMQSLGAPFKTWSDGAITPLAEEIPEMRRLNETDLEDREGRLAIMNDPAFAAAFKAMWMRGKQGFGIDRIKRLINLEDYAFHRNMAKMTIERCPMKSWQGWTFDAVFKRVIAIRDGQASAQNQSEAKLIAKDFAHVQDEGDFMLQMLRSFDTQLSWSTVTANESLSTVRELLMNPLFIPGFNDSGAHLTNMAFYDVNLRSLKLAAQGGDKDVTYMVKRLTQDAAELFGVDGGTLDEGAVADVILIDPNKLAQYEGERSAVRITREEIGHEQLVNRSNGVVDLVVIGGKIAWHHDEPTQELGKEKMGRLLTRKAM
ncbi:MAG: hypothetical protein RL336_1340 [Pseudomonadota bacterium]